MTHPLDRFFSGPALPPPARPTANPALPFSCACGARRYATYADWHTAEPNGSFKCPNCHTFATDHDWRGDEFSDYRCYDCDIRMHSHGTPPART